MVQSPVPVDYFVQNDTSCSIFTVEKARVKVGGMEFENKRRSRIMLSRSRSRSPLRTKQNKKNFPKTDVSPSRTEKKWTHDKFQETLNSPGNVDHSPAFGNHWSQIRSERSKERDRRSESSGSRYCMFIFTF